MSAAVAYAVCHSCGGRGHRPGEEECASCVGSGQRAADPESIALPIHPHAIERVEGRVARLLTWHRVPGAQSKARTLARALVIPPNNELVTRVAELCGVSPRTAISVVHEAVNGLAEHAQMILAHDRYREDRIAHTRAEADRLRVLAAKLERALPRFDQRLDVLEDLRWTT